MQNWNPDEEFLLFIESGMTDVLNEPFLGSGETVKTGADVIKEMREGTEDGQTLYNILFTNPQNTERFKSWKEKRGK